MNTLPVDPGNNDVAVAALSEAGRDLRIINTPIGEVRLVNGIISPTYAPIYFSDWIDKFGPKANPELDVESFRLGHVQKIICDDDPNNFIVDEVDYDNREIVKWAQDAELVRLLWEENIPGMPEELHVRLFALREMIANQNWESIDDRRKAYEEFEGIRNYIKGSKTGGSDNPLSKSLEYYEQQNNALQSHWKEFYHKHIKDK